MKKLVLTLTAIAAAVNIYAQGTVNFQNLSGTGQAVSAAITNSVTGQRAVTGSAFLVQLYYGAAGTAAGALVSVSNAPINFSTPGVFIGSTRTLLESVIGSCAAGPVAATLQVRAWQASLGSSWDVAWTAANRGDRTQEVLGMSSTFNLTTGNPCAMPPTTPANMAGFRSFALAPIVSEPSTIGLGVVGLAALAFLRRRK